jgi:hypothetical protein
VAALHAKEEEDEVMCGVEEKNDAQALLFTYSLRFPIRSRL